MNDWKLIRIEWEGPLTYDQVRGKSGGSDYGLYQIYSQHTVFGPNSLVYIGKATEQSFATRFEQHWQRWLEMERELTIYLGRLWKEDYGSNEEWAQLVSDLEKLAICRHTPPYNSQYIQNEYEGQQLFVQCWGDRGRLLPEFSSHWRVRRPDDTMPE